jgi:putative ABC transport system permease protein
MVLSTTALNVGAGIAAGIFLCFAFNKLATKWVNESSRDPLILGVVTLILIAAAALACFVPARRASSIDPMEALRYE